MQSVRLLVSSRSASSLPPQSPSLTELAAGDQPFVLADALGQVLAINAAFTRVYGWCEQALIGRSLGLILPEAYRMSHQLGFSRFQATGQSTVLAHPLRLMTLCADGRALLSEHFIVAEQCPDGWRFGATLTPLEGSPQPQPQPHPSPAP